MPGSNGPGPSSRPYSPKCLEHAFSEVVAPASQLCYLACKRSVGERGDEEVAHDEAHPSVGYSGAGHGGDDVGHGDARFR
jgi:hypothetical protein